MAGLIAAFTPTARAITHLEYLQWMVQLTGDGANFSAASSAEDFVQWARSRGMEPTGGWNADGQLTSDQLAESLVQLYSLGSKKAQDNYRILEREGIIIDRTTGAVTRRFLATLIDDPMMVNRLNDLAKSRKSPKCDKPPKPPKPKSKPPKPKTKPKTKCKDPKDDKDDKPKTKKPKKHK